MKYRKIINWSILGASCCLIIINQLADMPILGWVGDVLLLIGLSMLPPMKGTTKYRKIINWSILGASCCLIIINRLVDMPILGWAGDMLLLIGLFMLQTAAIDKK